MVKYLLVAGRGRSSFGHSVWFVRPELALDWLVRVRMMVRHSGYPAHV